MFFRQARTTLVSLPALVKSEATFTRSDLAAEVRATRGELLQVVQHLGERSIHEIATGRRQLFQRIDKAGARADEHIMELRHTAMMSGSVFSQLVVPAVQDVQRTTASARNLMDTATLGLHETGRRLDPWTECRGNGNCYQATGLAALGSTRYTLGKIAKAADRYDSISVNLDLSSKEALRASTNTANAMANIAELTKPMKWYIKWPLRMAGAAAPIIPIVR